MEERLSNPIGRFERRIGLTFPPCDNLRDTQSCLALGFYFPSLKAGSLREAAFRPITYHD